MDRKTKPNRMIDDADLKRGARVMDQVKYWTYALLTSLLFSFSVSVPVRADVVFSTLPGPVEEDGGSCFAGGDSVAVGFHTPGEIRYRIRKARVHLQINQGEFETPFALNLYDDASGFPGSKIGTIGKDVGTFVEFPTFEYFDLVPDKPIPLSADTTYWAVIESSDPSFCAFGWNDGGADPSTTANIFTFVEEARSDGAAPWFYIDGFHQIELYADKIGAASMKGALHTYEEVSSQGCEPGLEGIEYCWQDNGFVTAIYTPSGNVFGKSTTYSEQQVLYKGAVIQEISGIDERQGLFKDGEPFTWKADRMGQVCTVNPYTGESVITSWTYRYANGEFKRQDIQISYGDC